MRHRRFSPREIRFLELYFAGDQMKAAARAAGYRGTSPQALCNRGRKILIKFGADPNQLFRRAGTRGGNIARLLSESVENGSEHRQLQALMLLSKCL